VIFDFVTDKLDAEQYCCDVQEDDPNTAADDKKY